MPGTPRHDDFIDQGTLLAAVPSRSRSVISRYGYQGSRGGPQKNSGVAEISRATPGGRRAQEATATWSLQVIKAAFSRWTRLLVLIGAMSGKGSGGPFWVFTDPRGRAWQSRSRVIEAASSKGSAVPLLLIKSCKWQSLAKRARGDSSCELQRFSRATPGDIRVASGRVWQSCSGLIETVSGKDSAGVLWVIKGLQAAEFGKAAQGD
ncbi:hypothetical protein NDU88_004685 [Pleurodeles waltl]|uniref:Uncharacterized protein n=1 Tax=Pleurodeles waltl TaxID=8319 RepID=A0AAV7RHJ7_PLEWA|nr:hypothetical protein NDU88_004685 [Pleurodeles waltl]